MATYTWTVRYGLVSNPHNWTPAGVPTAGNNAVIATGLAAEIGDVLQGVPIALGNATPADAPTLQLANAGTTDVLVGTFMGGPVGPPQYANLITIGNNTLEGGVGGAFMGEPDQSALTIRNIGSLDLASFSAPSKLTINNTGIISGNVGADHLVVNGGIVKNAVLNTAIGFHNGGGGNINLTNTTLGANVTITINDTGDPPDAGNTSVDLGNVSSSSDVIGISWGKLVLEKPLTFLRPPPETINISTESLITNTFSKVIFQTAPFTSATYSNGVLDLHQAHDVLPLHVNFGGSPGGPATASDFVIAESAPSKGLVTAWLEPAAPASGFPPQPVPGPGSTIIHIT